MVYKNRKIVYNINHVESIINTKKREGMILIMENDNVEQELDLNQLMLVRKEKLDKLKQEGKDPYTITKFNRTHTSKQIIDNYDELEGKDVTVAGRIMAKRIMGKASFCHIQDSEGKIQSYVSI